MVLPTRNEVPKELTWDLTRVFPNDQAWQKEFKSVSNEIDKLSSLSTIITKSGSDLYSALTQIFSIDRRLEKVYVYATMSRDVDTSNNHYLGFAAMAEDLANKYSSVISFVNPAILSLSDQNLKKFELQEPKLAHYKHYLDQITNKRQHTLDAQAEQIIAASGAALNSSSNTYNVLTNSDMEFGYTTDNDGEMVQLSEGLYSQLIQSPQRSVRQNAFETLYASYGQFQNTLASTLSGNVKAQNYAALMHGYANAKEASLSQNNIPVSVYDNLVNGVHKHLDLLHRYMKLRKKVLGLQNLEMYDLYVPITGTPSLRYSYKEAKDQAREALSILGKEYLDQVDYIFNNRVIDVVESKSKVTGAYSGGSYDTDPYELLNWTNDFDALYTLVHETGHSVHSAFTRKNQPYVYGEYPIFLAEIASTTNENILTEYLLSKTTDPKIRAFILNYNLEAFRTTLYRQTQFAEFEQFIHEADQNGEPLTAERLNTFYGELNQKYYGIVEPGSDIDEEWARIPHFYYNFYVYQYSTGFAAAVALAKNIVHGTDKQKTDYLNFLKAGSSEYPIDIMKKAGVDMTTSAYLDSAFSVFEQRLNELEKLL